MAVESKKLLPWYPRQPFGGRPWLFNGVRHQAYSGEHLRAIRAVKGVGRPPKS